MFETLLVVMGAYGISTIVSDYDGPFGLFSTLRSGRIGKLFDCNVCLLPYVALILFFMPDQIVNYAGVLGGGVVLARLV